MDDVHIIITHYNEDLDWTRNLKYKYTIHSNAGIPVDTAPNKGNEVSGYLTYIINNYDTLHEYTIFLHGHRTAWHCKENVDEKVNNLIINRQYCNINDSVNKERIAMWCEMTKKYIPESIHQISLILNEPIHTQHLVYNQAAQFYVHKDLIRRHSKEKYLQLYSFLMNTDILSWLTSRAFEYTWHYIFTGDHHDHS
jgi:hypothetical protein